MNVPKVCLISGRWKLGTKWGRLYGCHQLLATTEKVRKYGDASQNKLHSEYSLFTFQSIKSKLDGIGSTPCLCCKYNMGVDAIHCTGELLNRIYLRKEQRDDFNSVKCSFQNAFFMLHLVQVNDSVKTAFQHILAKIFALHNNKIQITAIICK